jgi:hypothetical protein
MPLVKAEPFEVMDVYKRALGNFTDRDAKREGLKTLEQLKEWWVRLHLIVSDSVSTAVDINPRVNDLEIKRFLHISL